MLDLFDLSGKIAVVTGAGTGLGHGYALNLAKAGANVICLGRNAVTLERTVAEIGDGACYRLCDVSDTASIKTVVDSIAKEFGRIDILVNNAGTEYEENIDSVTEEHFDRIMAVNIKGTYMMCKAVTAYMKKSGGGKIINIGSLGSFIGLAGSTGYCSSKGAVLQFTKALAVEVARDNIQVNAIAPGYFLTEMTAPFFEDKEHSRWINERIPIGRVGTEADLAGALLLLASKASDYITGTTITVDGGWLAS